MKRFFTLAEAATFLATGKPRTVQHLSRLMRRHRGGRAPAELWRAIEKAANEILIAAQGGEFVLTGRQDGDGQMMRKQIPEIALMDSSAEPARDSIYPDYLAWMKEQRNIDGISIWRDVAVSCRDFDKWRNRGNPDYDATIKPSGPTREATDDEIHAAITAVYDEVDRLGGKPPNVKELIAPLRKMLGEKHLTATRTRMDKAASAQQHKDRRLKVGARK